MSNPVFSSSDPLAGLENSYAALPEQFHARLDPEPVPEPGLIRLNRTLAGQLGWDAEQLCTPAAVEMFAGNRVPEGSTPLAMAYAGHQFGNFVPQLGDGRAILLGERLDAAGKRWDIQLKGSGRTPFSRSGDGRAVLGPVLREYVLGEAMTGLGIPSTRALAMVVTGEPVYRERPEQGAILTRVAASHLRVGTFEYFARRGDTESVKTLADYAIARHYPACAEAENPYRTLLGEVCERQGALIARWLLVGFIHGVMNTDNMTISGETIDYGPCAFMDPYHPGTVFSSIDRQGRYAFANQPNIGLWNLSQLAGCLLGLFDDDEDKAREAAYDQLDRFKRRFEADYPAGLRAKIGLTEQRDGDDELVQDLLGRMAEQRVDFTNLFRGLCDLPAGSTERDETVRALFETPEVFDEWAVRWRERLAAEVERDNDNDNDNERQAAMRAVSPAYIPRNHRVQEAIEAAEQGDLAPLDRLLEVVSDPFDEHPGQLDMRRPPRPEQVVHRTFCGT